MWEMQILNTQQGRVGEGSSIQAAVEAPLSPASSVEAANSPTPATTANACINGLQEDAMRPIPSPPHTATSCKTPSAVAAAATVVTSSLGKTYSYKIVYKLSYRKV